MQRRGMTELLQAVFEYDRGHPERAQPVGILHSLALSGKIGVAATGTDDHRRAVGFVHRRRVHRERGFRDIRDVSIIAFFLTETGLGSRHSFGPEGDDHGFGARRKSDGSHGKKKAERFHGE